MPLLVRQNIPWLVGLLAIPALAQPDEDPAQLREVSVVAESDPYAARRHASTTKIVYDRQALDELDASSLAELMRKLPGTGLFVDTENRRKKGKGADRYAPTILVDGEALPGSQNSPQDALRLPVDLIERVEIIRNPGPDMPSAGPAGIINLVLRDVPPSTVRNLRTEAGLQQEAISYRAEGQYGENQGDFAYLLALATYRKPVQGDQESERVTYLNGTPQAWRQEHGNDRGHEDNLSISPRLTWHFGSDQQFILSPLLNLTQGERRSHSQLHVPITPTPQGRESERESQRGVNGRLAGEWRQKRAGDEYSLRLTLQGEDQKKRLTRREAGIGLPGNQHSREEERRQEQEAALSFKARTLAGEAHLLGFGAEWRYKNAKERKEAWENGIASPRDSASTANLSDRRLALWLMDEWQISDTHLLTPGLRYQRQYNWSRDGLGTEQERRYASFSPSLHYLWQASSNWNLRASLGENEKPPGLREMSHMVRESNGNNSPGNPDKGGNPNLKAERTRALEVGVEHFLPQRQGNLGLNLFRRWVSNHVEKITALENGRWVERPWNVGDAVLTGALLDWKMRLTALGLPNLNLRGNYSHAKIRIAQESPHPQKEGPRRAWNLGFDYDLPAHRLTLGGNLSGRGNLVKAQKGRLYQEYKGSQQLDLYLLKRINRQLAVRLSASNVTHADRDNEVHSHAPDGSLTSRERSHETHPPVYKVSLEARW